MSLGTDVINILTAEEEKTQPTNYLEMLLTLNVGTFLVDLRSFSDESEVKLLLEAQKHVCYTHTQIVHF